MTTNQNTQHNLINGDCLEELKKIPDESIDLIFADPPYGLAKKKGLGWPYSKHITLEEAWDIFSKDEYFDFSLKWITECMRVLKSGGSFWVCGSFHNIYQIGFILHHLDAKINNSVVWFKPNAQPNITCRMFTESCEHLIWAAKNHSKTKWTFNYQQSKSMIEDQINPKNKQTRNVWAIPLTPKKEKWAGEHPTQKPIELLRRVILCCSKENELILDPFVGSGTTCVAAYLLSRKFIGIERDPQYFALAQERVGYYTSQKKLFDTFDEPKENIY